MEVHQNSDVHFLMVENTELSVQNLCLFVDWIIPVLFLSSSYILGINPLWAKWLENISFSRLHFLPVPHFLCYTKAFKLYSRASSFICSRYYFL